MKVTFFKYSHSIDRFSNRNAIYVITYSLPFHFNPNFCLEQEILQSERCLSSIKFHDHRINLKICFLLMERTRLNFGRHQRNDISLFGRVPLSDLVRKRIIEMAVSKNSFEARNLLDHRRFMVSFRLYDVQRYATVDCLAARSEHRNWFDVYQCTRALSR